MARHFNRKIRLRISPPFVLLLKMLRSRLQREPTHQFPQPINLSIPKWEARHSRNGLQLQTSAIIKRDSAKLERKHVLWAIDDDLKQTVQSKCRSDLRA